MLSDELLAQIRALDAADKVELFGILRDDPALAEIATNFIALRNNYEAARILQEMLEGTKAERSEEH